MRVTDDYVREAISEVVKQRILPSYDKEHDFPLGYLAEVLKGCELDQKRRRQYIFIAGRAISKVAMWIIIILLMGSISIYAMIKSGLLYEIFDNNTNVRKRGEEQEIEESKQEVEELYLPLYLPGDFEKGDTLIEDEVICTTIYTNEEGGQISIRQQPEYTQYNLDSEDTELTPVIIDEVELGVWYVKNQEITLIWYAEDYCFEISAYPTIQSDELIRLAESLSISSLD